MSTLPLSIIPDYLCDGRICFSLERRHLHVLRHSFTNDLAFMNVALPSSCHRMRQEIDSLDFGCKCTAPAVVVKRLIRGGVLNQVRNLLVLPQEVVRLRVG